VSSGPSPSVSPLEHESASGSLDTSLKHEGPVLDSENNTFSAVVDSMMALSEVGSEVFSEVQRDGLDPQPSIVGSLAPDSAKLSSLTTVIL
jgi:hypothetical protein